MNIYNVVDLLNLALNSETEVKYAGVLIKREVPVIIYKKLLNNVYEVLRILYLRMEFSPFIPYNNHHNYFLSRWCSNPRKFSAALRSLWHELYAPATRRYVHLGSTRIVY